MAQQHFWDRHYDNVLPPLSPQSSRFCGETYEPLTDLPYTILSSSPLPDSSPSKTLPHPNTLQMQPLTDISRFSEGSHAPSLHPLSQLSAHAMFPERSQTPAIADPNISSQGPASPLKPVTSVPSSPGKENKGVKDTTKTKKRQLWTGAGLVALARAVLEKEPFVQPHGKKGKVWDDIKEILVTERSIAADSHATAVQHKAESLVSYWKNPKSTDGRIKSIAKIFEDRPTYKITIAALMDGIDNQWDRGRNESEVVKEKNQKKKDEDTEGGEVICHASLQTMGLRKHQDLVLDDKTDTDGNEHNDHDNHLTRSTHKRKYNSIASLDDDDSKDGNGDNETIGTGHKRQRSSIRRVTGNSELLEFLRADSADWKAHQERLEEQGAEMTRILQGFFELDKARFEQEQE
ncbi:hypothetical protein GGU11DRAFT_750587 [Lentinula aff. detonsa]|nr:hypothetical protein GGU11DRAFT_750587 [Lentinula aff. detonsa]